MCLWKTTPGWASWYIVEKNTWSSTPPHVWPTRTHGNSGHVAVRKGARERSNAWINEWTNAMTRRLMLVPVLRQNLIYPWLTLYIWMVQYCHGYSIWRFPNWLVIIAWRSIVFSASVCLWILLFYIAAVILKNLISLSSSSWDDAEHLLLKSQSCMKIK